MALDYVRWFALAWVVVALLPAVGAWTALVLSGGGAKGAFEVGVLDALCAEHSQWADSWSMVLGTSIGALNGGLMAQFPQEQQCSHALPALRAYWDGIQSQNDVFAGPRGGKCLSPLNLGLYVNFEQRGGLCDPAPGLKHYTAAVKRERIQRSGMKLRVVASGLHDGRPRWWSEQDPSVVDGCMASGSIAPLVFPKEVEPGNWYVDGGIFDNTPILKALSEGADKVLAVLLQPPHDPDQNYTNFDDDPDRKFFKNLGGTVIQYYVSVTQDRVFLDSELRSACKFYPTANIYGVAPTANLGSLLAFDHDNIEQLILNGTLAGEPKDLCAAIRAERGTPSGASGISAAVAVVLVIVAFVLGVVTTILVVKRQHFASYCHCLRGSQGHQNSPTAPFHDASDLTSIALKSSA